MKKLSILALIRLAIMVLPVLLIVMITLYFGIKSIQDENKTKIGIASRTSQNVAEKIDRNLYERYGDVQAFAYNILAKNACNTKRYNDSLQDFANTMMQYYALYDLMIIVGRDGNVLNYNTKDKNGKNINSITLATKNYLSTTWFERAIKQEHGQAYFSDFEKNEEVAKIYQSNGKGISFAAPIRSSDGTPIGVWYNFANGNEVLEAIRNEVLSNLSKNLPGSEIVITNSSGDILSIHGNASIKGDIRSVNNFQLKIGDKNINHELYISNMYESKGAYSFSGNKWRVYTFIPAASWTFSAFLSPVIIVIDIIILLGSFLLATIFSTKINTRINTIITSIERLTNGELENSRLDRTRQDELGKIESSINKLIDNNIQTASFAKEVGKGNFNASYSKLSDHDTLGQALLQMQSSLLKASENENKRRWVAEGMAKFSDKFNKEKDSVGFFDSVLKDIVKYVNASMGAIYVAEEDTKGATTIEMKACYAFDRKKHVNVSLFPNEGLIGQAFVEKAPIKLTEIPESYYRITSGIGSALPKYIVVIPMVVNSQAIGVLEVASLRIIEEHEMEFLNLITDAFASVLLHIKAGNNTKLLLEESQAKTEALLSQEEELRQNMEEILATQEAYERKEKELLEKIKLLSAS